jgi:hypothetical protein
MQFTDQHLDQPETYLKLRRALIRIMGRAEPNLAQVAGNMGVDAQELTAFVRRHLGSPNNLAKKDLDKLNAKFGIGVKEPPATQVDESPAPAASVAPPSPVAPVTRRSIEELDEIRNAALAPFKRKSLREKTAASEDRRKAKANAAAILAPLKGGSGKGQYARDESWYINKWGAKRGAALWAKKQAKDSGALPASTSTRRPRLAKGSPEWLARKEADRAAKRRGKLHDAIAAKPKATGGGITASRSSLRSEQLPPTSSPGLPASEMAAAPATTAFLSPAPVTCQLNLLITVQVKILN